ncbi:SRPBCC family protein [Bdellovibrio sp. GT3]|uniref:SRPBCC family protein n=1 Tax=Bdellovibrio sp. GT3 TaxID=3136282 RepID=UPI0030EFABB1
MQTSSEKRQPRFEHKDSTTKAKLIEIEREYSVPVRELWQAFTNPEALKQWWWPNGIHAEHVELEATEGGRYFISMNGYDGAGPVGGMTGRFEEVVENERLVMTDQFADKRGKAITPDQAQMPGGWSDMAYITFEFESDGSNGSRFKLSQQGIPNEYQKDCIQGWSESFDKLESYLSKRSH